MKINVFTKNKQTMRTDQKIKTRTRRAISMKNMVFSVLLSEKLNFLVPIMTPSAIHPAKAPNMKTTPNRKIPQFNLILSSISWLETQVYFSFVSYIQSTLQISQQILVVFNPFYKFCVTIVFNHSTKHQLWTNFMLPVQAHGEMSPEQFVPVTSTSARQILQLYVVEGDSQLFFLLRI